MKTKHRLVLPLIFIVGFMASGCKKSEAPGAESAPGGKEIVFWHWWTDRQPILEELAKQYKEKTGVVVQFQVAAPVGSDYKSKVQAAAQANTLPDIIGIAEGGEFLARYINAGKIVDLTAPMNQGWKKNFYPRTVEDFSYKKGNQYGVKPETIWAVPISAMAIQIYYNKALFRKAGLDPEKPPQDWKSFLETGKKLAQSKIMPLTVGFGDLWMIGAFLEPYAWSVMGEKKMRSTLLGQSSYLSPEWEKGLNIFVDLKKNDMLVKGSVSQPNKESEQLFASGRCGMIMNGSWGVSVFKKMNSKLEYGVMRLPKAEGSSFPLYVRGGVGCGAAVSASSKNRDEAVKFLQWMTAKEQQVLYANQGLDLPANKDCVKELSPELGSFASCLNDLIPDIQLSEKYSVQEALWKGIQTLFISETTPNEVLQKVQEAKERSLKGI